MGVQKLMKLEFQTSGIKSNSSINCIRPVRGKVSQSLSRVRLFVTASTSVPGSSVHGILQARIVERVALSFSRESSRPRDQTWVSCIAGRFFTIWATREAQNNGDTGDWTQGLMLAKHTLPLSHTPLAGYKLYEIKDCLYIYIFHSFKI